MWFLSPRTHSPCTHSPHTHTGQGAQAACGLLLDGQLRPGRRHRRRLRLHGRRAGALAQALPRLPHHRAAAAAPHHGAGVRGT
eukprot:2058202-Prymnesium_polylepis.1